MNRGKTTTAMITTAAVGMAVGTAAYMLAGNKSKTRQLKKSTGKALRQVGSFIDNVSYMIR